MCQGILRLEQHWLTRNQVHIVIATLLGLVVTDCYYASKYIHPTEISGMELLQYVDRLAFQLINSDAFYSCCTSGASSTGEKQASSLTIIVPQAIHVLKPGHVQPVAAEKEGAG